MGSKLVLAAVVVAIAICSWLLWRTSTPSSAGAPHPALAIDADPTNGTRPCDPVDSARGGAPTSGTYSVGICLINSDGPPDAFDALVTWTAGIAFAPDTANAAPALDDNPNANDGPGPNGLGTMWDCTGFGFVFPTGGASSARIVCNDTTFGSDSRLTANPGLLALIIMEATGAGAVTFAFDTSTSQVNSPSGSNYACSLVTCPGATVNQDGPTSTPTASPTPTPTATPCAPEGCPTATATTTPTATNTGIPGPRLAIDADPTNGARPCDPIDITRVVAANASYAVAICLDDNAGGTDAFEARVTWTGGVASAPEVANLAPALDDNPDANQGPGPNALGTMWDCTGFGLTFPTGGASSAHIICHDTTFGGNSLLTANPGLLATITMNAVGSGTTALVIDSKSNINSPPGMNFQCTMVRCTGATVFQGATATPCPAEGCPTETATATATFTITPTPTPTDNFDGDLAPYGNGTVGFDSGPGMSTDGTLPNSDLILDWLDPDDDNDGLLDADEFSPTACGAFDLSITTHPNPARGDYTTLDGNGASWDTDGDGVLDGVECLLGANPRSAASKPGLCTAIADQDGDGLTAGAEFCRWGTSDTEPDSDGDGRPDCLEANDTNGDGVQNYPRDTITSAKVALLLMIGTTNFDLNGDGVVNFPGDTILSAKMALHVPPILC